MVEELGISEATLNNWVYNARRAKKANAGEGSDLIEENLRLRIENEQARRWRDIETLCFRPSVLKAINES